MHMFPPLPGDYNLKIAQPVGKVNDSQRDFGQFYLLHNFAYPYL